MTGKLNLQLLPSDVIGQITYNFDLSDTSSVMQVSRTMQCLVRQNLEIGILNKADPKDKQGVKKTVTELIKIASIDRAITLAAVISNPQIKTQVLIIIVEENFAGCIGLSFIVEELTDENKFQKIRKITEMMPGLDSQARVFSSIVRKLIKQCKIDRATEFIQTISDQVMTAFLFEEQIRPFQRELEFKITPRALR